MQVEKAFIGVSCSQVPHKAEECTWAKIKGTKPLTQFGRTQFTPEGFHQPCYRGPQAWPLGTTFRGPSTTSLVPMHRLAGLGSCDALLLPLFCLGCPPSPTAERRNQKSFEVVGSQSDKGPLLLGLQLDAPPVLSQPRDSLSLLFRRAGIFL